MRKHTLIALSAFSALGASAMTGAASSGTFNTVSTLTRSTAARFGPALAEDRSADSRVGLISVTPFDRERRLHFTFHNRAAAREMAAIFAHSADRPRAVLFVDFKAPRPNHKSKPKPKPVTQAPYVPPTTTATSTAAVAPAGGVWYELRMCESGNNYSENTGNGYYGAYQFALSTWYGLGFTGLPSNAPPAVQDEAAAQLQAQSGWGQWPACSAALGL